MKSKKEFDKILNQLKGCLETQKNCIGQDEYMQGMYNGMEFVLASFENREPKYETIEKTKKKLK